jgi:hypothetical protein
MIKRTIIAIVVVFIAWSVLDFIIHGLVLQPIYVDTAALWRPMEEMNNWLMSLVGFISAAVFTAIYAQLIKPKKTVTGLSYGLLFGLGAGISMGFGTYCVMPIPFSLAIGWFLGTVIKATAGGWLAGLIVKEPAS